MMLVFCLGGVGLSLFRLFCLFVCLSVSCLFLVCCCHCCCLGIELLYIYTWECPASTLVRETRA